MKVYRYGGIWLVVAVLTVLWSASPLFGQTPTEYDKFALWTNGTQLRGANIWQRVVVPEVDGPEFLGSEHVGPPYTQADFDRLASMGANYVNISGPGLFTEWPPYAVDEAVQANLDSLLAMIAQADMFAVISARTGPLSTDFDWCEEDYCQHLVSYDVWTNQAAQSAWVEMWRHTAERYRHHPIVVGYDLMVEPNAAGALLDIYDGEEFYAAYAGTVFDWNQLYPRIVAAIREVDPDTPVLIGGMGWSKVAWLPYLQPVDDGRTVYMAHQYAPQSQYTHQSPIDPNSYPGSIDLDWDGQPEVFDSRYLDALFSIIDEFKAAHDVPVAVNEFGVVRWVPGGADFIHDQMVRFEERGMNHALWAYFPAYAPFSSEVHAFNYAFGPDFNNVQYVDTSPMLEVIVANWSQNTVRPSTVGQ